MMMRTCLLALAFAWSHGAALPPLDTAEVDVARVPELVDTGRELQEDAGRELQEAAPKDVSVWGMAKRFFTVREKIKAKQTGGATAPTAMPKDFGVGYKQMLEWYCAKSENAGKALCTKKSATSGNVLASKPPMGDSVAAVRAYCSIADNKQKPLCSMSKLMGHHVAAAAAHGAATATVGVPPAPTGVAKAAGSVSKEAKVAKKAAKKAAKTATA